jgi:hypothetical protein
MRILSIIGLLTISFTLLAQTDKEFIGEWKLDCNPNNCDTLIFKKYHQEQSQNYTAVRNPNIIIYLFADNKAEYYNSFSNAETTDAIIVKEQPQTTYDIKIDNGDTTITEIRPPIRLDGATLTPKTWDLSTDGETLILTDNKSTVIDKYKVVALTEDRLTVIKIRPQQK